MTLPRRPLGRTGIDASRIGLGTVKIGRLEGLRHARRDRALPDDDAVRVLLRLALELGVNLLDTAPAYGVSEERLGALLPGARSDWVLCTKVGEEFDRGASWFDFTRTAVRASVQRSLRRLRTDVLDVVLIHSDGGPEGELERPGPIETLRELQREGLIRAVGASTKTPEGAQRAVRLCDVVMLTRNPETLSDDPAIDAAHAAGVGVLVKKPLAQGRFGATSRTDPVRAAIRHALSHPGVTSAVVGTTKPQHLRDVVEASGFRGLVASASARREPPVRAGARPGSPTGR
jgi:aryl-alcohol dehydrogenase-like predicted oxidoreductase